VTNLSDIIHDDTNFGLLVFQDILTNSKLLEDPKLCIVVYKVLAPYIEVLEGSGIKFIDKLIEYKVIEWDSSDYPKRSLKRAKIHSGYYNPMNDIQKEYTRNPKLKRILTKNLILIIINFLYQLIEQIQNKNLRSMTLAVNLFDECRKKLSNELVDVIEKEIETGNIGYLYTNFMIRSFKYFKDCTEKLEEDIIFNSLFRLMKEAIKNKDYANWIPDFMQVWLELMYRNSKVILIQPEKFGLVTEVLNNYEDFCSINNSFPFAFITFATLKNQDSNCLITPFFENYTKKLVDLVSIKDRKLSEFPDLRNRARKAKNEEVKSDEDGKSSNDSLFKKYTLTKKNKAMIGLFIIRNFIENIFLSFEPLLNLII